MHWITRVVQILFITLLVVFWLLPTAQRTATLTWIGLLLITGGGVYLSLVYRHLLSTWRGFGALIACSFLSLVWLRWQWPLWQSSTPFLRNANVVVGLLAWALLIAVFISSALLLIRKDASVTFMGLAWILIPLILLAVGTRYDYLGQFSAAPLGEQVFWGVPLLWALGMLCLGPLAFVGHFLILIIKELKAH